MVERKHPKEVQRASILADYSFYSTSKVDSLFQFIDCSQVSRDRQLAKDIRAGVVAVEHRKVVIALGNNAQLDGFTNVAVFVSTVVHALIDRYGCVNLDMFVLGMLPRPLADAHQVDMLKQQNTALFRVVRSIIHRRQAPVRFVPAYKWFLKRVKHSDGNIKTKVDTIYFDEGHNSLSQNGQVHLHLLLANLLKLKINYEWKEMPLLDSAEVKQVAKSGKVMSRCQEAKEKQGRGPLQLRQGHGNRWVGTRCSGDEDPPKLVEI